MKKDLAIQALDMAVNFAIHHKAASSTAIAAALLNYAVITPDLAGAILLLGSLVIVVEAAVRDARKRAAAKGK